MLPSVRKLNSKYVRDFINVTFCEDFKVFRVNCPDSSYPPRKRDEILLKGWYRLNAEETQKTGKISYKRISKVMSPYYPLEEVAPSIIAKAYDQGIEIARFYKEEVVEVFRKKYDKYQIVFGEFPD